MQLSRPAAMFPLFPIVNGKCGCGEDGCTRVGKHPAMAFGELEAGQSAGAPEEWGAPGEDFGVGICTGTRSGFFVVDADVRPDKGLDGPARLAELGGFPDTLTVKTGNGWQYYFQLPDFEVRNGVSGISPGVDIRGEGGFVVGPGSPHASGRRYELARDLPIAPAPSWLLDRLKEKAPSSAAPSVKPVDLDTPEGQRRVREAELFLSAKALPSISGEDGQGRAWGVALRLMRFWELPIEKAYELWDELYNPRCVPEWESWEVWRKLEQARDCGQSPTGCPSEGWLEEMRRIGQPPALRAPRKPLTEANRDRRKAHDPKHYYNFSPNAPCTGEAEKKDINDLIHAFTSEKDWIGVWQYNEFKRQLRAVDPPMRLDAETTGLSEEDVTYCVAWFRAHDMLATKEQVRDAIKATAKLCRFHPVREYLDGLPEIDRVEAQEYLESLSGRFLGVGEEHARIWFSRWLVAAVRRIIWPGTKVDTMLVLYGGQGAFKSTMCEALFGREWFRDQMPELNNRDASHALEGFWGVEIAELSAILRTENRSTKEFLSRCVDKYRQFGNGEKVEHARESVFIGTTNDQEILRDPSGERRFLPIGLPEGWTIPIDQVREERDRIWACAYALALDESFRHWTSREEERQHANVKAQFQEHDPWESAILDYCAGKDFVKSTEEIYTECLARGDEAATSKLTKPISSRIGAILTRLGCRYRAHRPVENKTQVIKAWVMPESIADASPSPKEVSRRVAQSAVAALRGQSGKSNPL